MGTARRGHGREHGAACSRLLFATFETLNASFVFRESACSFVRRTDLFFLFALVTAANRAEFSSRVPNAVTAVCYSKTNTTPDEQRLGTLLLLPSRETILSPSLPGPAHMSRQAEGNASGEMTELSRLEIRVGRCLEVSKHPDADSLYVEKVDFGEGEPR